MASLSARAAGLGVLEFEAYARAQRVQEASRRNKTTAPTCPSQSSPSKLQLFLQCSIFTLSSCSGAAGVNMKRLSLVALAASLASVQSEGLDIDAVNPKIVEAQ